MDTNTAARAAFAAFAEIAHQFIESDGSVIAPYEHSEWMMTPQEWAEVAMVAERMASAARQVADSRP